MKEPGIDTGNLQFRKLLWMLYPSAYIYLVLVSGRKLGEKKSISVVMSLDIVVWRNQIINHLGDCSGRSVLFPHQLFLSVQPSGKGHLGLYLLPLYTPPP